METATPDPEKPAPIPLPAAVLVNQLHAVFATIRNFVDSDSREYHPIDLVAFVVRRVLATSANLIRQCEGPDHDRKIARLAVLTAARSFEAELERAACVVPLNGGAK